MNVTRFGACTDRETSAVERVRRGGDGAFSVCTHKAEAHRVEPSLVLHS